MADDDEFVPTLEEQRMILKDAFADCPMQEGETWFLIDNKWWTKWQGAVGWENEFVATG